jgi:4'-phosphopantetheinyl transferase
LLEQIVAHPNSCFSPTARLKDAPSPTPSPLWLAPPDNLLLRRDVVHVWQAALGLEAARVDALWGTLSADEQTRAGRFYLKRDSDHFIIARGLLRTILGRYLRRSPRELCFSYNQYGKPRLVVERGEEAINFNVSHSDSCALFAFTRGWQVGVDVERIRTHADLEDIARRFFSPRETAVLARTPAESKREAFFTCWVRKEAFIKARGLGLSLSLDSFDVLSVPGRPVGTTGDAPSGREILWSIIDLPVDAGYRAALATEGRDLQVSCFGAE